MPDGVPLEIERRDEMSLLGLMLGDVLGSSLSRPENAALARKLSGGIGVRAGSMEVAIRFEKGRVVVSPGAPRRPTARVAGSLDALLQVSLGRGAIRSFLAGEISFSGNPLFLLKVLPLLRVGSRRREEG